jgi:hypothetical protein
MALTLKGSAGTTKMRASSGKCEGQHIFVSPFSLRAFPFLGKQKEMRISPDECNYLMDHHVKIHCKPVPPLLVLSEDLREKFTNKHAGSLVTPPYHLPRTPTMALKKLFVIIQCKGALCSMPMA